jgi:hypothetical protein
MRLCGKNDSRQSSVVSKPLVSRVIQTPPILRMTRPLQAQRADDWRLATDDYLRISHMAHPATMTPPVNMAKQ